MQLVEQGKLSLSDSIHPYLDFEIKERFNGTITIEHLLTHTPGFEDYPMIGSFVRDPNDVLPLWEALSNRIPRQDWAAGMESAYSNYGSALAGHIVEQIAGVPYAEYVNTNILTPLGMTNTSVQIPLPSEIKEMRAEGHVVKKDEIEPIRDQYYINTPTGH